MKLILLVTVVLVACSASDAPPAAPTNNATSPRPVKPTNFTGVPQLPELYGHCLDDPAPPTPALCDWIWPIDGLFLGTITSMYLVDSPAVYADGSTEVVTCESGIANRAMTITLAVTDTLHGPSLEEVTFRIGFYQLETWTTQPVLEGDEMTWVGDDELVVGQPLGVALQHGPEPTSWAMPGLHLWTVRDNTIVMQEQESCLEPPPEGMAGATVEALAAAIEACSPEPTPTAEERARLLEMRWEGEPAYIFAAVCF